MLTRIMTRTENAGVVHRQAPGITSSGPSAQYGFSFGASPVVGKCAWPNSPTLQFVLTNFWIVPGVNGDAFATDVR
jgi:hypothetical protein